MTENPKINSNKASEVKSEELTPQELTPHELEGIAGGAKGESTEQDHKDWVEV